MPWGPKSKSFVVRQHDKCQPQNSASDMNEVVITIISEGSAFCDGTRWYGVTAPFFMLRANFVKINLRHAVSLLVLDMHTGTFLCPNSIAKNN